MKFPHFSSVGFALFVAAGCAPDLEGQAGGRCFENQSCFDDLICVDGVCEEPDREGQLGGPCFENQTCFDDLLCIESVCQESQSPADRDGGTTPTPGAAEPDSEPSPAQEPAAEPDQSPEPTGTCGDGLCTLGEPFSCPDDCAPETFVCGNGNCEEFEFETCPSDCLSTDTCGDSICAPDEDPAGCPTDCACGDNVCSANESASSCPADCPNAPQIQACEAACNAMIGCLPTVGEESFPGLFYACQDRCRTGTTAELAGVGTCGPGSATTCGICLLDQLGTCGNGLCEVYEDEDGDRACPSDCPTLQNTYDACSTACSGYSAEQCWFFDSESDECFARCWGSAPERRQAFVDCANPTESLECLYRDCTAHIGMQCGDLTCADGEDATNCPLDCAEICGDRLCAVDETEASCPEDCSQTCGDGICALESCATCPQDCGECAGTCGDGQCGASESCSTCQADCGTCGATCGDGQCTQGETCETCTADCGECGPTENEGTCFDEFRIITTPLVNTEGAIGGFCDTYTDCLDGTVMILDEGNQCVCTPLCANLTSNAGDFEPCVPGDPRFICVPALGGNGDWARICVHREGNLCYEVR